MQWCACVFKQWCACMFKRSLHNAAVHLHAGPAVTSQCSGAHACSAATSQCGSAHDYFSEPVLSSCRLSGHFTQCSGAHAWSATTSQCGSAHDYFSEPVLYYLDEQALHNCFSQSLLFRTYGSPDFPCSVSLTTSANPHSTSRLFTVTAVQSMLFT